MEAKLEADSSRIKVSRPGELVPIKQVQELEGQCSIKDRDMLEQRTALLKDKQEALAEQRSMLELEMRGVEATLDRTERAWHEALAREAELLKDQARLEAVCQVGEPPIASEEWGRLIRFSVSRTLCWPKLESSPPRCSCG